MDNIKKSLTIFVDIEDIHLHKDPGMIPVILHKDYKFKPSVLLWENKKYSTNSELFAGIEFITLKYCNSDIQKKIKILIYLCKNAKKYSLVHLYFFERWTWIYIWAYRLFNKKGIVYVHCDTNGEKLIDYKYPQNYLKQFLIKKILLKDSNIENVLWGIQNKDNCKKIEGKWPFYNLAYIPNGVYWEQSLDVPFENRSNILLTVARNGSPPKKTEILLEGFAAIAVDFPNWKLQLVGTVEKDFEKYIEDYFVRNPKLKNRVMFTGPISDKNELQKIYSKAKVFCLTSAWEGFSLVMVEAMSCGCFIISSDIPANIDVTQNGKFGELFKSENLDDFIEKLRFNINNEDNMQTVATQAQEYARKKLTWEKVLEPVNNWVETKIREEK